MAAAASKAVVVVSRAVAKQVLTKAAPQAVKAAPKAVTASSVKIMPKTATQLSALKSWLKANAAPFKVK
jgi:hypothetical protein